MGVWDDFKAKYNQPQMEKIIVGFSGIDPELKDFVAELTPEQIEKINKLILDYLSTITIKIDSGDIDPDAPPPEVQPVPLKPAEIPHELLDKLLGGDEDGHYHLTQDELHMLNNIINALIPDKDTGVVKLPQTIQNHEQLSGLKGGATNEHYHFNMDEWTKLLKVLAVLFPDGATEPKFPLSNPEDTPSELIGDADGGLPTATPPDWVSMTLPNTSASSTSSSYAMCDFAPCMYYGKTNINSKVEGDAPTRLLVWVGKITTSGTGANKKVKYADDYYLLYTTDLSTWTKLDNMTIKTYFPTNGPSQYMYLDTCEATTDRHRLYMMLPDYPKSGSKSKIPFYDGKSSFNALTDTTSNPAYSPHTYIACCFSENQRIAVFVSKNGHVARIKDRKVTKSKVDYYYLDTLTKNENISCGINVNFGCAAYMPYPNQDSGIFCVTGDSGSATCSDGTGWEKHPNSLNLKGLTYRSDIRNGNFLAWSDADKYFYCSGDGRTWARYSEAPIPLSSVAALVYSPELKLYCVVGGASRKAYFSRNLGGWIETKVVNDTSDALPMSSLVYMPNTGKFVLMPTYTGNTSPKTFYTFTPPNSWKEA